MRVQIVRRLMRRRLLASVLCLTAAGTAIAGVESPANAIAWGQATTAGSTVALLRSNNSLLCSGTQISPHWVLTSAHCITPELSTVVVDSGNFINGSARRRVGIARTVKRGLNDIAVVQLTGTGARYQALLPSRNGAPPVGSGVVAYGYGTNETNAIDGNLRFARATFSSFGTDLYGGTAMRLLGGRYAGGIIYPGDSGGGVFSGVGGSTVFGVVSGSNLINSAYASLVGASRDWIHTQTGV